MKLEITEKGCYGPNDKPYQIGDIVEIKGDVIPASFVNKARPVGRVAVTNPATGNAPGGKSQERIALEARAAELGLTVHPNAKDETVSAKIKEAEEAAAEAQRKAAEAAAAGGAQ